MHEKWFIVFCFLAFPSISFGDEIDEKSSIYTVAKNILAADSSNYQPVNNHQNDINIKIQNDGQKIVVDAYYYVPTNPRLVWATLTDFNNIANFTEGVASSKITRKKGNTLRVAQTSEIRFSGVSFNFESIIEVHLVPFKGFSTRMISGNMSKMHEITRINSDGDQTHIYYHADIVPNMWILKYIGHSFIADEAKERLQQVRKEIIRRKKAGINSNKMKNNLRTPEV